MSSGGTDTRTMQAFVHEAVSTKVDLLPLYVAAFEFRYNNRKNADIFGAAVARR